MAIKMLKGEEGTEPGLLILKCRSNGLKHMSLFLREREIILLLRYGFYHYEQNITIIPFVRFSMVCIK